MNAFTVTLFNAASYPLSLQEENAWWQSQVDPVVDVEKSEWRQDSLHAAVLSDPEAQN